MIQPNSKKYVITIKDLSLFYLRYYLLEVVSNERRLYLWATVNIKVFT